MIGYTQSQEEKDEKLLSLSEELRETKIRAEELNLELGTVTIHHDKLKE